MSREFTCREVLELLTDYLEAALPNATSDAVEEHLAGCDGCTGYIDQLRATIRVTGALREHDVAPDVLDALLSAFRTWTREL